MITDGQLLKFKDMKRGGLDSEGNLHSSESFEDSFVIQFEIMGDDLVAIGSEEHLNDYADKLKFISDCLNLSLDITSTFI